MDKILTTKQIQSMYGIDRNTLRHFIRSKKIKATKIGRLYFVRQAEIDKLFSRGENG